MKKNERIVLTVVVATGVSSVVTQLLTIREFLAQFQGNEFVIALIFFNWLMLGGLGALLSHLITARWWRPNRHHLAWLSLALIALSPLQILAIRYLKNVFFIPGASVGFYPTLAYSLGLIAPYSLLLGFLLPYSLFVIRDERPDYPGARLYIADNLGDAAGGALFSFALVFLLSPLEAVLVANLPLLATVWRLFSVPRRAALIGLGAALMALWAGVYWERSSLQPLSGQLVEYIESRYGRIAVHRDHDQYTLFVDGAPLYSNQNLINAEETIHYPLSQLSPQNNSPRILLIAAQAGMFKQLQKYDPRRVDYVELDPDVARIQFQYGLLKKTPGLNLIHQDGRAYLAPKSNGHSERQPRYDAIIINLPEPETFQLNRFFTDAFFQLAKRRLAPGGVLSFSASGFDNYLGEPQRQKISCLYNTAAVHFKHILLLPGQSIIFLCRDQALNADIPALLEQKKIDTQYIRDYYYGNLNDMRIRYLNDLIDAKTPINQDQSPYLMRLMFAQWFAQFASSPTGFMLVLAILAAIYVARISREEFVLFSTGVMTMGSEILVIFAFQIFFGYIYFWIGGIVTIFLAGLLPGAWIGNHLKRRCGFVLVLTDMLLIFLLGIFIIIHTLENRPPLAVLLGFGLMISVCCGCQFPAALHLQGDHNTAAGKAFSADLLGAALGALGVSVVLIPYVGLVWTAVVLMGLKGASLIALRREAWIN